MRSMPVDCVRGSWGVIDMNDFNLLPQYFRNRSLVTLFRVTRISYSQTVDLDEYPFATIFECFAVAVSNHILKNTLHETKTLDFLAQLGEFALRKGSPSSRDRNVFVETSEEFLDFGEAESSFLCAPD